MANLSDETGGAETAPALPSASFGPLLAKEIERSRRYYRGFGLLRVRPAERPSGEGPQRQWVEAVTRSVRRADLLALAPGGGFYILLPETPASGVPTVSRRIEKALGQAPGLGAERPPVVITHAAYPRDGETAGELLEALIEEAP